MRKLSIKEKVQKWSEKTHKWFGKTKNKSNKLIKKLEPYYKRNKTGFTLLEVIIIVIIASVSGMFVGVSITEQHSNKVDIVAENPELNKFVEIYNSIISKYYTDVDKNELLEKAINGMLSGLENPYTSYTDSEETKNFLERVEGVYYGIGCEISMDSSNNIIITKIFKDFPAEKAGLLVNDIVLSVNGTSYIGKTSNDVASFIKGYEGINIELKVKRNDQEIILKIKKEKINIPSVTKQVFEKNNKKIGYLKVDIFSAITDEQFKTELLELEKENINSLIIDVRDNSGGYLDAVTNMASLFLGKDKIIYQLQDQKNTIKKYSSSDEKRSYPIAVLINKNSASASEILAAAIKESYNGLVIGTNSFGKATVQQTKELSDGSMIKYTIQKWLTPNGNWVNTVGVEPTNIVDQSNEHYQNPTNENDTQLQKALELMS